MPIYYLERLVVCLNCFDIEAYFESMVWNTNIYILWICFCTEGLVVWCYLSGAADEIHAKGGIWYSRGHLKESRDSFKLSKCLLLKLRFSLNSANNLLWSVYVGNIIFPQLKTLEVTKSIKFGVLAFLVTCKVIWIFVRNSCIVISQVFINHSDHIFYFIVLYWCTYLSDKGRFSLKLLFVFKLLALYFEVFAFQL